MLYSIKTNARHELNPRLLMLLSNQNRIGSLPEISARNVPENFELLAQQLGVQPDKTGLRSCNPVLNTHAEAIRPVEWKTTECYTVADLMGPPHAIGIVTMTPSQAASFAIEYIANIKADSLRSFDAIGDARVPAHTIWIPFSDHQTCATPIAQGALRLYVREDASYELFMYSVNDDSRWAHGDDYLIVFHRV